MYTKDDVQAPFPQEAELFQCVTKEIFYHPAVVSMVYFAVVCQIDQEGLLCNWLQTGHSVYITCLKLRAPLVTANNKTEGSLPESKCNLLEVFGDVFIGSGVFQAFDEVIRSLFH